MDNADLKALTEFSQQFNLLNVLGKGAFGEVWIANHHKIGNVAIKFSKNDQSAKRELEIYKLIEARETILFGIKPIPAIHSCGNISELSWLAMDLLGPSLDDIHQKLGGFTIETILMMGIKMLNSVEYLHRCGIVHGDIKGDNFALSATNPQNIVIFDFGLAREFGNTEADFHGSVLYASIATHEYKPVQAKDDIESLGYLLADYYKPLPWQDGNWPDNLMDQIKYGLQQKKEKDIFEMTTGFFEMALFLMHVDAQEKPDIIFLKEMFRYL